jgi:hypothetical protein
MVKVDFPAFDFRIKKEAGKEFIFDELRKRWVRLTPEEWVRQNLVQYLIQFKKYPASFIGIEKEIKLGELKKRFDILVYNQNHQPWMMIECKAMDIKLDEDVLQQVLRYNAAVPVMFLVITNGLYTFCYKKNNHKLESLDALPVFAAG